MQVVLASRNAGKLQELREIFAELDVELISQADLDIPSAPEESSTFVENALGKARFVAKASGLPALADDSGLVVPALMGAPGIDSALYAGTHGDDRANNRKLIDELRNVGERSAFFFCALTFLLHEHDPTPLIATGRWHGSIVDEPRGEQGFGYDPHFKVRGLEVTAAQLAKAEKNQISHRGLAAQALLDQWPR